MHLCLGIESKFNKHIHLFNKHLIFTTYQLLFYIFEYGSVQQTFCSLQAHFLFEVKQLTREVNNIYVYYISRNIL